MKKALGMLLILSFVLPVILIGCSSEKTEEDWVDELRDKRTRDNALMYVQEHKTKKAVPELVRLVKKRYGTLKAIYALGVIGDTAAVPALIEELKNVAKKDSLDHDRMTEQICMSLGMIGATQAVDDLIWAIDNSGEMGRAGAIQALGMIGDPRATQKVVEVLKNNKEKITIRHYAAITLGRLKAAEAADALVYALIVDDGAGLNLFRDGQLSLIQIGGKAARDALIKGYELKNEDAMALAKEYKLDPVWLQIKIVNVLGEMRDPENAPFLMGEFEKGVKNDLTYELYAKIIQALERTPLKKEDLAKLAKVFLSRPKGTEYLNEREILSRIFIFNNYTEELDDVMKVAESGDITLRNAQGKRQDFSQWCVAAANVVSIHGDETFAERFDAFAKSGKCDAKIWGLKTPVKELLANFNERLKASANCKKDIACWEKQALTAEKWQWREKALYILANTNDPKYMDIVMKNLTYPKEEVRAAILYAIDKLMRPEDLPMLIRFWQDQKINKEYQKITESIGYVLFIKMREMKLDDPKSRRELFEKAHKLPSTNKTAQKEVTTETSKG